VIRSWASVARSLCYIAEILVCRCTSIRSVRGCARCMHARSTLICLYAARWRQYGMMNLKIRSTLGFFATMDRIPIKMTWYVDAHSICSLRTPNFTLLKGRWVWQPPKFNFWSNLQFLAPQRRHNASIDVKCDMIKSTSKVHCCTLNFPWSTKGCPKISKLAMCVDILPVLYFVATRLCLQLLVVNVNTSVNFARAKSRKAVLHNGWNLEQYTQFEL